MARKDTPLVMQRKRELVASAIKGRVSASSSSLSASFGLGVDEVRRILRTAKVTDND